MRFRALALFVAVGLVTGCEHAPAPVQECNATCGACGAGEVCVSYWYTQAPASLATCMKSCTDSRDCPSGYRCISVEDAPLNGKPQPNACISTSDPRPCAPPDDAQCSDLIGSRCDGATLITNGFGHSANNICGFERVNCPNGCEALDGGVFQSSVGRCR